MEASDSQGPEGVGGSGRRRGPLKAGRSLHLVRHRNQRDRDWRGSVEALESPSSPH